MSELCGAEEVEMKYKIGGKHLLNCFNILHICNCSFFILFFPPPGSNAFATLNQD